MATNTTFSFDVVEELVDQLFDKTDGEQNAAITYENGYLTLTTCEIRSCAVKVYHVEESKSLYERMEIMFLAILENAPMDDDFWDMWNAMLAVLDTSKIVEETLNP